MPASSVRVPTRVAPEPEPPHAEAAIARMVGAPGRPDPDAVLITLGQQFDARHAAWLETAPKAREADERIGALLAERSDRHGGNSFGDHEDALNQPGVREALRRESDAFDDMARIGELVRDRPARTLAGLAVKARVLASAVWPTGTYSQEAGPDEDYPNDHIRDLIEATCALAGVDVMGRSVVPAPAAAVASPRIATSAMSDPTPASTDPAALIAAIEACWIEAEAADSAADPEADERAYARRGELLDAAERLPPTRESVPAKALALAWLEYAAHWERGRPRSDYATDGRLALDIHAGMLAADESAASHADAALLILGRCLDDLWAIQRCQDREAGGIWNEESRAASDEVHGQASVVVRQIAKMPATTLAGLAIKARACSWCHDGEPFTDGSFANHKPPTTDVRLVSGILRDLLAIGAVA